VSTFVWLELRLQLSGYIYLQLTCRLKCSIASIFASTFVWLYVRLQLSEYIYLVAQMQSAQEAAWWWDFDPVYTRLFDMYEVANVSRIDQIMGLFCRI